MSEQPKILLVDDEETNLNLLKSLCHKMGYGCLTSRDGRQAVEAASTQHPDLIMMDVIMPEMDGFEATRKLKSDPATSHIPVIMVTAASSREDKLKGIACGANDFITKPVDVQELSLRIKNNLNIKEYHDFLKNYSLTLEQQVKERTVKLENVLLQRDQAFDKIKAGYIDTIFRLTLAAEYKDGQTGNHIRRTSHYAKTLALEMGLDQEFAETIYYAMPMHDIGKVGIPDSILLKPGPLNAEEWLVMKEHTTIGSRILTGSQSEILNLAQQIALTHHEHWDGKGYPQKLAAEQIPLAGRIANVVDQYDAIRSRRTYKPRMDHRQALNILTEGDDRSQPGHFDPGIIEVFRKKHQVFEEIYKAHAERNEAARGGKS
ncbi:response regulator [candidate division TA06 bacterium]|uniref:Response regulator n=1 Tax=candidate division TA06 bacterium TaxID=2250710 RepID=A0A933IBJ5_UNCT6|nr:response regulator [candidate division TA06 bacterium]